MLGFFLNQFLRLMNFIMWNHFHGNYLLRLKILIYSQFFHLKTELNRLKKLRSSTVSRLCLVAIFGQIFRWAPHVVIDTYNDIVPTSSFYLHPEKANKACSYLASVARWLWMVPEEACLRRTGENNHNLCPFPSAPLPKAVVSFGSNMMVCQHLSRYCPLVVSA